MRETAGGKPGPAGARRGRSGPRLRSGRLGVLAARDFRVFYSGYVTSLLGSAMADIAITFAVLDSGGSAADLGFVFAANIVPLILFMLGGGVLADRLGRRPVMLVADAARLVIQAVLAIALFAGRPPIWLFVLLAGLLATAEAFFTPAFSALPPQIAPPGRLADVNALLGVAQSVAKVAGPALAGVLIAAAGPAVVIAVDAASYGASVLALALLRAQPVTAARASPWRDLARGWAEFRSRTWMWVVTLQFSLFNLFTWAPYLLLGPILARQYLGGARAWGAMSAALAAASILTGLALVGRRPRHPLVTATIGTFGYAAPCLALALRAPLPGVIAAAAAAGVGSCVSSTYAQTVDQQQIPPEVLGRVSAIVTTFSFSLGGTAFAVIGPVSEVVGTSRMLLFAACWSVASSAVVLSLPAIRVPWRDGPPSSPASP